MIRPLNAAQRYRLTSSLFLLTFFGAIFTVAAPTVFPCPALEGRQPGLVHADGWAFDGLTNSRRRRQRTVASNQLQENMHSENKGSNG